MQRRHHYEQAFERYLRSERVPYVAVDEAKKALMPEDTPLTFRADGSSRAAALKSFDFVLYGSSENGRSGDGRACNVLAEVKGRRVGGRRGPGSSGPSRGARLETWVTMEDVESLRAWGSLFGPEFVPAFVFVYWCEDQPPDALFQEIFEYRERWYAVRAVTLDRYVAAMKVRSPRWGTVHVPPSTFERISQPLLPSTQGVRRLAEGFTSPAPFVDAGPELPVLDR